MKCCKCVFLIILFVCGCILNGCSPLSLDDQQQDDFCNTDDSKVVQGTSIPFTYSVENAGLFYIGRNHRILMYYDFNSDKNYSLCSSPNCMHKDSACPAYVGDNYKNYAFAYYRKKLYLLKQEDYESKQIELISMDPGGQNQNKIASIEIGEFAVGKWAIRTSEDTKLEFPKPVEDGWYMQQSSNGGYCYEEDEILVCHDFFQDDTFCLYRYSLSTQKLIRIAQKKDQSTIWGVTDHCVIVSEDSSKPSWVTKEDFEKGNMDCAVDIHFDW